MIEKLVKIIMGVVFGMSVSFHGYGVEEKEVSIPTYPSPWQISNSKGEMLVERKERTGEFSSLVVLMAVDSSSDTGYLIPTDIDQADSLLRKSLGVDLYNRLLASFEVLNSVGVNEYDPDISEIYYDLSRFFDDAWNLSSNCKLLPACTKHSGPMARFFELLLVIQKSKDQSGALIQGRSKKE